MAIHDPATTTMAQIDPASKVFLYYYQMGKPLSRMGRMQFHALLKDPFLELNTPKYKKLYFPVQHEWNLQITCFLAKSCNQLVCAKSSTCATQ